MAQIVAKRLGARLEGAGFVVMKRAPIGGASALGRGHEGRSGDRRCAPPSDVRASRCKRKSASYCGAAVAAGVADVAAARALLREMKESGERETRGRPEKTSQPATLKLDDLGVTKTQSHRWQKPAALDGSAFEQRVAAASDTSGKFAGGWRSVRAL